MMILALAPSELITACRAESVNSVIQVRDIRSAAGRVSRKTRSIINSLFGLAKLVRRALTPVDAHSTFAMFLPSSPHAVTAVSWLEAPTDIMFVEIAGSNF